MTVVCQLQASVLGKVGCRTLLHDGNAALS
jgi:hypothetical protein